MTLGPVPQSMDSMSLDLYFALVAKDWVPGRNDEERSRKGGRCDVFTTIYIYKGKMYFVNHGLFKDPNRGLLHWTCRQRFTSTREVAVTRFHTQYVRYKQPLHRNSQ